MLKEGGPKRKESFQNKRNPFNEQCSEATTREDKVMGEEDVQDGQEEDPTAGSGFADVHLFHQHFQFPQKNLIFICINYHILIITRM